MTAKNRATLKAENASDFPDNVAHSITPADLRGQMDDIVDSALFPEDDISGPPGPPGASSTGLYDAQLSGAVGDGTTDARAALLAADGEAASLDAFLYIAQIFKVNSNLTLTSPVVFGPAGRLKPASGVTVTLAGGFEATPVQHVFDISLGGDCWPTVECKVTARNYGAVANDLGMGPPPVVNSRAAFQHLIDCRLYFQKTGRIELDGGNFFISGGPLTVNYGNGPASIELCGAGSSYGTVYAFPGTYLRTDYWGNLFEVNGARGMTISHMGLEGPFHQYMVDSNFFNIPPTGAWITEQIDHLQWVPTAAKEAGVLNRFKMNCAIHIDPRGGPKPITISKADVKVVVTDQKLTPAMCEAGDVIHGVTLVAGDRILQAVSIDLDGWPGDVSNGVYVAQPNGTGTLVRASDLDAVGEFPNAQVNCTAGTDNVYAGTKWVCNNNSLNAIDAGLAGLIGHGWNIDFRQFDGVYCYEDLVYPAWTGISTQYGKARSSFVTVEHVQFQGWGCALAVMGCDYDGNGDFVRMDYCGGQYNVYAFAWGQTQARSQGMVGCQWSQSRACVSTTVLGRQQGKPHFKAVNCEFSGSGDILDIPNLVGAGVSLDTCLMESGWRIGRCSGGGQSGSFEISGGSYGFESHQWYARLPRYIIDCAATTLILSPAPTFVNLYTPLIIAGEPTNCLIHATILPVWMSDTPGTLPPAPITKADSLMKHSTMDVLFLNVHQGPWKGGGYNWAYNFTTAGSTATFPGARYFGRHMISQVTAPIPFCADTAAPYSNSYDGMAEPYPVALGRWGAQMPTNNASYFVGAPSQTGRTLTLTIAAAQTPLNVGKAQNSGWVPGSIIYDPITKSLFVIETTAPSGSNLVISAKLLNNYNSSTLEPYSRVTATPYNLNFVPTGHYTPAAGVELQWTTGTATVTTKSPDGVTDYAVQFPVGAAKMVNDGSDALTPILRANSGVSASVAGTITMTGNARATAAEGTKRERAGIWFVPR